MIKRTVSRMPTTTTTRRRVTTTTTMLPKPFKRLVSKTTTRKNSTTTTRSAKANKLAEKIAKPGIGINRWERLRGKYREEMNKKK